MTSKIKVDNINKVSDDSNIIKKCGTTTTIGSGASNPIVVDGSAVTLGRCGGTVALASGATQTGFGRTGTVDWDTTPKTATFTAVSGDGFFANTTGSAFNMNLPAGSAGAIVSVADYAGTWNSNALTVVPNGTDKIGSVNDSVVLNTEGQSVTFIFVDSTQGWINTMDSTSNVRAADSVVATGGNSIVTCGDYKIHVFTGPGTFAVSCLSPSAPLNKADYMVVAGGGGGALCHGGAGGAGGYRESPGSDTGYTASPLGASPAASVTLAVQSYPIVVGAGGPFQCSGSSAPVAGRKGSDSSGLGITSTGGGGGGAVNPSPARVGGPGGSGASGGSNGCNAAGNGNDPPVNPAQGNPGGASINNPSNHAGGGGGATSAGVAASPSPIKAGNGGAGASTQIINPSNPSAPSFGSPAMTFAGGGGGGSRNTGARGDGGSGGGGCGQVGSPTGSPVPSSNKATNGTANTGGGGGSSGAGVPEAGCVGSGGSGIVMIRYKFK
jgi:hypothetical protein